MSESEECPRCGREYGAGRSGEAYCFTWDDSRESLENDPLCAILTIERQAAELRRWHALLKHPCVSPDCGEHAGQCVDELRAAIHAAGEAK